MRNIPHSPAMIKAFVAGDKTETRRTRGLNVINEKPDAWELVSLTDGVAKFATKYTKIINSVESENYPYGKIGDVVYLGEGIKNEKGYAVYSSDGAMLMRNEEIVPWRWKTEHISSVYMPAFAARCFARIKSVRVERLHDISREAAIAEGIEKLDSVSYRDYLTPELIHSDPLNSYYSLWKSINGGKDWSKGAKSWNKNPWVWVTQYEPVTKEEAFPLPTCKYCTKPGEFILALVSKNQKRITSRDIIPTMICAEHMVDALIQLNDSCFGSRCFPAVLDANKKLLLKSYNMPTRDILSAWEEVQQGLNKTAK